MKTKFILLGLLSLVPFCDLSADVQTTQFKIENLSFEYRVHAPSVPGLFYFAPYRREKKKSLAYLVAIDTQGKVLFERPYEHSYRDMMTSDFKEVEAHALGYFIAVLEKAHWSARYYFLTDQFDDLFLRPVPNYDADLDPHFSVRTPGGNTVFLFDRKTKSKEKRFSEIQEWDARGNTLYTWSVEGLQFASLDFDSDGGMLIGSEHTHEILKLEYPSGKVLWRLQPSWKFIHDPLGGFVYAHDIHHLPNGNLLILDSGDAKRPARAVEYKINEVEKSATLIWEYRSSVSAGHVSGYGSVARLSNGNTLVGWGSDQIFTEVTPNGQIVRELVGPKDSASNRVYFKEAESLK